MKKRPLLAAFVVIVSVLTLPTAAEACSCGGSLPLSVSVNRPTAIIFVGTVEGVTGRMPQPIVATFSVEKTYRGRVERRAVVSGDGSNCDRAFVTGESYLVYAQEHGDVLLTDK